MDTSDCCLATPLVHIIFAFCFCATSQPFWSRLEARKSTSAAAHPTSATGHHPTTTGGPGRWPAAGAPAASGAGDSAAASCVVWARAWVYQRKYL